jgi:transcriptional regulator NrdR family protein
MHDTFLIEKLYNSISELCKSNMIKKINEIKLIVSLDSHVTGQHMLEHLMERDSTLFGDWTCVYIEKQDIEKLTAMVESINGETDE